MSEKQAKRSKKNAKSVEVKKPINKTAVWINVIITVVVLAVVGLGVYALGSKYYEGYAAQKEAEELNKTVAEYIDEKGLTFDEFKAEYGLADNQEVTEDSVMSMIASYLTLENYAKYQETTVLELKAEYGLSENVENTTIWSDALEMMTTGIIARKLAGVSFEEFKTQLNLPEEITEETPWGETQAIVTAMQAQAQAEAETPAAE